MQMLLKSFRSLVIQDQETDGPPECRHDQGKEENDHWERLYSPGCPGTCFTASNLDKPTTSASQVLGLLVYISIPGKHIPYTKKDAGYVGCDFFPHYFYTSSVSLRWGPAEDEVRTSHRSHPV